MNIDRDHKLIVFDTCHDKRALALLKSNLEAVFSKDSLHAMLMQITTAFPDYFMRMSNESWMLKIRDIVSRKAQTKKGDMVDMVAKIYASESNRCILDEILSDKDKQLWTEMLRDIYVKDTRITQITGRPVFEERKQLYYSTSEKPVGYLCWFGFIQIGGWYRAARYFYIPDFVRRMFAGLFGMPPAVPTPAPPEDNTEGLNVINTEIESLAILPVVNNLYLNGQLERGKFKVGAAAVNRAAKMLKLTEFVTTDDDRTARNLRTSMLLNAYSIHAYENAKYNTGERSEPQDIIRAIATYLAQNTFEISATILHFIDKSSLKLYEGTTLRETWRKVTDLLYANESREWIPACRITDALYGLGDINNAVRIVPFRLIDETSVSNSRSGHTISPEDMFAEATVPAALSVLVLYISLGMVEARYATAAEHDPSVLSGLHSFRLTPLGAYALNLTKEYTFIPPESDNMFTLDTSRLIIRAGGENNPYEGMMSDFGREIAGHRYAVSAGTFLKGCSTPREIDKKIKTFRQVVCDRPPQIWEDFFNSLKAHSNCFSKDNGRWIIFDVDPTAYELHDLLVTDPVLSEYIIRAEGYRILAYERAEQVIRDRLRNLGYLL